MKVTYIRHKAKEDEHYDQLKLGMFMMKPAQIEFMSPLVKISDK